MIIVWMEKNGRVGQADCEDFDQAALEILGQAPVAVDPAGLCDPYIMLVGPKTKCEDKHINHLATYLYGGLGLVYGSVVIGAKIDGVIKGLTEVQADTLTRYIRHLKKCMEG